jgi:hypothetical protein
MTLRPGLRDQAPRSLLTCAEPVVYGLPRMQYRRLGRSNLMVSVVGFGTCQLRRVPEQQALDTLRRGFELGVNLVHTAPD